MVGSVIQATGTVKFDLRIGILHEAAGAIVVTTFSPRLYLVPSWDVGWSIVVLWTPLRLNSNVLGSIHQWY